MTLDGLAQFQSFSCSRCGIFDPCATCTALNRLFLAAPAQRDWTDWARQQDGAPEAKALLCTLARKASSQGFVQLPIERLAREHGLPDTREAHWRVLALLRTLRASDLLESLPALAERLPAGIVWLRLKGSGDPAVWQDLRVQVEQAA